MGNSVHVFIALIVFHKSMEMITFKVGKYTYAFKYCKLLYVKEISLQKYDPLIQVIYLTMAGL